MTPRRPDSRLCEQFFKLVLETKEVAVQDCLESAYFAFEDGHLEAAIVLAWAAVEKYCNLVRSNIGEWYFDLKYRLANGNKDPKKHWSLDEFIKLSGSTQFFVDIKQRLERDGEKLREFEEMRHRIVHGVSGFVKSCEEAYEIIASAEFIFQRDILYEKIQDPIKLASEFLKRPEIPDDPNTLDKFMQYIQFLNHKQVGEFCRELYDAFLKKRVLIFGKKDEKEVKPGSLSGLCSCAIKTLEETHSFQIWEAFITNALDTIESTDPGVDKIRDAYAIFEFMPIPTLTQASATRDGFYKCLFETIERDLDDMQLEYEKLKEQGTPIPRALDDKFTRCRRIIQDLDRQVPTPLQDAWASVYDKYENFIRAVYLKPPVHGES
ncbi:hypothetical protein HUU05_28105 [candidate division KSB1 bacterium]|nr:hypothetical protein [candidate division KSB1 bacterium]